MTERTKKSRGRPRKTMLERQDLRVTVRLRIAEAEQLELFAREAGMSASEFLRTRALTNRPPPAIGVELKHDLYRLLLSVQRGLRDGLARELLAKRMQAVVDRLQA